MQPENQQPGNFSFRKEDEAPQTPATQPDEVAPVPPKEDVTWTASEFIALHRNAGWYLILAGGLVALCGLIYFFTKDIISIVAITVVALLYLVVSNGKPRNRTYRLNGQGISIDEKFYSFSEFKSFTVTQEGAIGCISFLPLKRLLPEISVYFAPQDSNKIFDILTSNLPHDERQERSMDRLMKKLHF